jgi:PadR family transcriptional regulator, regulatory protein PadR
MVRSFQKTQFLKGCARTLVLQLLAERPMYGYELATELDRRSNGIFALGQGTLYPLLYSLQAKGLIRVAREETSPDQGRKRRYYTVTASGRMELESNLFTWQEIARGMKRVLGAAHA